MSQPVVFQKVLRRSPSARFSFENNKWFKKKRQKKVLNNVKTLLCQKTTILKLFEITYLLFKTIILEFIHTMSKFETCAFLKSLRKK